MSQGKESPLNRRRSIAVVGGSKPSAYKHKRRTYSMVGGDRLSPLAKARRSLVGVFSLSLKCCDTIVMYLGPSEKYTQRLQYPISRPTTCGYTK